jgi:hypothetical protein
MATAVLGGALLSASLIFLNQAEPERIGTVAATEKHKSAAQDALARSPLPDLGEPLTTYHLPLTAYY